MKDFLRPSEPHTKPICRRQPYFRLPAYPLTVYYSYFCNMKTINILRYLSFGSAALLTVVLVAASVTEHLTDSDTARRLLYTSPLTLALWCVCTITSLVYLTRRPCGKHPATLLFHAAFAVILAGAAVTHFTGETGSLTLFRGGKTVNGFLLDNGHVARLPFSIRLIDCHTDYHPGTLAATDYVSIVEVKQDNGKSTRDTISMNRILDCRNFRFYQTSMNRESSTFTITHDPWGIGITYTGYLLLLTAGILFFFNPRSDFRRLLRHPLLRRTSLILLLAALPATAGAETPKTLQRGLARHFGELYIYHNDRVCPVQTLATDFCICLCGKDSWNGLTAEQVLTGWIFYYEDWRDEPMIRIKSRRTRELLGIRSEYASLSDFYSPQGYKLEAALSGQPDKDILEADGKCRLAETVCTGAAIRIFPFRPTGSNRPQWLSWTDAMPRELPLENWKFINGSMEYVARQILHGKNTRADEALQKIRKYQQEQAGSGHLPHESRFRTEILYNRIRHSRTAAILSLVCGLLTFFASYRSVLRKQPDRPSFDRKLLTAAQGMLGLLTLFLLSTLALRGYISGHWPLSNGYETMQFMAFATALLTLVLCRRFPFLLPFGFLLCGLTLLVSTMGQNPSQISQLMPVLASPLLSLHVVVIMLAYSLLAFTAIGSLTALCIHFANRRVGTVKIFRQLDLLTIMNRLMLYPALMLLAAGIFIGAVWANQSWGTYWSWDPKETWALVTLLVYAFPLHVRSLPLLRRPLYFHLYLFLAFATVLMTYFGVNYILGGMHSYAG